MPIIL
jgi:hypothetical protein